MRGLVGYFISIREFEYSILMKLFLKVSLNGFG